MIERRPEPDYATLVPRLRPTADPVTSNKHSTFRIIDQIPTVEYDFWNIACGNRYCREINYLGRSDWKDQDFRTYERPYH